MRKRTLVSDLVKQLIIDEASKDLSAPVRLIRSRVTGRLKLLKKDDALPGDRAVQVWMRKAREKNSLDEPWSLGATAGDIPNDALPCLLDVHRTCLIAGLPFTVRDAMWVARLRHLGPEDAPMGAYRLALGYSLRERMAEMLGKPLDTADLDAVLAFSKEWRTTRGVRDGYLFKGKDWAYWTAVRTGVFREVHMLMGAEGKREYQEALGLQLQNADAAWSSYDRPGWIAWDRAFYVPRDDGVAEPGDWLGPTEQKLLARMGIGPDKIAVGPRDLFDPPIDAVTLGQEGNAVFAMWISHIAKTSSWRKLSRRERVDLGRRLWAAVAAQAAALEGEKNNARQDWAITRWQPIEILKEVGIEMPEKRP